MAIVETQKQGEVAVIRMDNPPVNALGHALRVGLEKAFAEANADAGVKAIVLTGTGRFFSAGADITEFRSEMKEPYLPQLIDKIEGSSKPVVAAVNGTALGGGLELSLGCHYRVAAKDVRQLGLPEIKLGIIPGAGGTQRLPRAIGVEQALQLITTGAFIDAAKGAAAGLIDKIADGEVVAAAVAFAKEQIGKPPRRIGEKKIDKASIPAGLFEKARASTFASSERAHCAEGRHRRGRGRNHHAAGGRRRARAPGVPRGGGEPLCARPAVRLLRRAAGGQPAGRRARREAARHQKRRHPRRRHHGHRHHARLPQRRLSRDRRRDHAGGARQGRRPHQGHARRQREARARHAKRRPRSGWPISRPRSRWRTSARPTSSSRRCSRTWR